MFTPKSNIVETGYTNGNYFTLPNGNFYEGYYHKDKFNNCYTEKENSVSSIKLTLFLTLEGNDPSDYLGNNKFKKLFKTSLINKSYGDEYISPTKDDYNAGYFTRYIAKVNPSSDIRYIEITKGSFDEILKQNNPFYTPVSLLWKIYGPVFDIYQEDIRIESGIVNTNLRSIQQIEKTIPGISSFLTDYVKYALITGYNSPDQHTHSTVPLDLAFSNKPQDIQNNTYNDAFNPF